MDAFDFALPRGAGLCSAPLVQRNRARGVQPDWRSGLPAHRHEHEIPAEIEIAALAAAEAEQRRTEAEHTYNQVTKGVSDRRSAPPHSAAEM